MTFYAVFDTFYLLYNMVIMCCFVKNYYLFQIPDSRLPLPTSSLFRTSRYSRHFDKGHFKWPINKHQSTEESQFRTHCSDNFHVPKKFSLCMSGIESSDESDPPRSHQVRLN